MRKWKCLQNLVQHYSTKPKVIPDQTVLSNIEENVYKPKNHPGIFKPRAIPLPEAFIKAAESVLADYPVKSLVDDGQALVNHLRDKRPPVEPNEVKRIKQTVHERVLSHAKLPGLEEEKDVTRFEAMVSSKVNEVLKKEVYNWKPLHYDAYNALVYLISRSPAEYAVLTRIFQEIAERDKGFKPRSLFDFGSGVGTVTWASLLYWKKCIFEYFNVDASSEMNDLAQLLLQNGKGTNKMDLRGVFYRQFLPASNVSYDLVVCAYTLLELPSRQTRLNTILNLWNKTRQYLVVVEQGSNAGFHIINEIRDFILHTRKDEDSCHVFSPCPHEGMCPRFTANDGTPCNFESYYFNFPFVSPLIRCQERYSYVVFKKGPRQALELQWPRVVRQSLIRPKHTICRMCTKDGDLKEVIFTASKHGKNLYQCARATKWGDLLPVRLEEMEESGVDPEPTDLK